MDINEVGITPPKPGRKPAKRKPTVSDQRQKQVNEIVETLDAALMLADTLQGEFEQALNQLIEDYLPKFETLGAKLDDAVQDLADFKGEIEEKVSNLEEKFSGTERYERLSEFSQALESIEIPEGDAFNSFGKTFEFDEALKNVQEAVQVIDAAKSELEGVEIP